MELYSVVCFIYLFWGGVKAAYPACSAGWAEYNGFCYKIYPTAAQATSAESTCVSVNGHLVSILSAEEDNFVKQQQGIDSVDTIWLGLTMTGDGYEWSDESPFQYSNFVDNIHLYQGTCFAKFPSWQSNQWAPSNCVSTYGFMCKKAAVYPKWSDWSLWTDCDCGLSEKSRQRECVYDQNTIPTEQCAGESQETSQCVCEPVSTNAMFRMVEEGGFYTADPYKEIKSRQEIECSRHCLFYSNCVMFQYNRAMESCMLFDQSVDQISSPERSNGWSVWKRIQK